MPPEKPKRKSLITQFYVQANDRTFHQLVKLMVDLVDGEMNEIKLILKYSGLKYGPSPMVDTVTGKKFGQDGPRMPLQGDQIEISYHKDGAITYKDPAKQDGHKHISKRAYIRPFKKIKEPQMFFSITGWQINYPPAKVPKPGNGREEIVFGLGPSFAPSDNINCVIYISNGYAAFNIPEWNAHLFPDAPEHIQFPVEGTNLILTFFFWRFQGNSTEATFSIRTDTWKDRLKRLYFGIKLGRAYPMFRDTLIKLRYKIVPKKIPPGTVHQSQEYKPQDPNPRT
ncbi:MAG TPA: hypothetical protein VHE10_02605 [Candidatus Paceibacterota bacterium]|nr:hypothetical protein [Candidatus Paceibacterota bacterium]